MKRVLIIPSNTDLNRGDQALVWESVRLIQDVYGANNVSFSVMASEEGDDAPIQKKQTLKLGYHFIPTLLNHPGRKFAHKKDDSKSYTLLTLVGWGSQAVLDYLHTRLLLSNNKLFQKIGYSLLNKNKKQIVDVYRNVDAIYVKGGGFIHSYGSVTDAYFIYYLTFHIRLALAFNKNVYVLPNSVGPLKNKIARDIALSTLNKCKLVTVRENISKQFLNKLGIDAKLYPDLGFFLRPSRQDMSGYLTSKGVPLNGKKVVLTLRPYRFQGFENADTLFKNYINGVVNLVQHLHGKGYHTTFLAHTLGPSTHEDDRIAIKEVMSLLDADTRNYVSYMEDFDHNCRDVERIYSYYDYMIGTRFHSVIFSLNVNVPSIAIAYGGNKGKGIMNVLENDDYSIDMDKIHDQSLAQLFDKLEANHDSYLSNLKQKRVVIEQQRDALIGHIKELENL